MIAQYVHYRNDFVDWIRDFSGVGATRLHPHQEVILRNLSEKGVPRLPLRIRRGYGGIRHNMLFKDDMERDEAS